MPAQHEHEPVIASVVLSAGHDGAAEAVVSVRYPNGALRATAFGAAALEAALSACGAASLDALVGRPWTVLVGGG